MIIDAHQHYWRVDRGDYGWLTPALGPLYRDFLPADLAPHLQRAGVDATVLVQAAATEAETRYLLDLAAHTPSVAGVVGWVDMEADDAALRIATLRERCGPRLKGIRPMIQDIPNDEWVASRGLDAAFDALEATSLAFDALVHPRHLGPLRQRLARNPGLRTVVDHCAKPDVSGRGFDGWARDLRAIARDTTACCKVSGLMTQLDPQQSVEALRPYVELVLDAFGTRRVLWGSDWPVLGLRADYRQWFECTQALLAGLDADAVQAILGGNAVRFYDLSVGGYGQDTLARGT